MEFEEEKKNDNNLNQEQEQEQVDDIFMDILSEGLPEEDPLLVEENDNVDDVSSEDSEELLQDLDWESTDDEEWYPGNWLQQYALIPGLSQQFPSNVNQVEDSFLLLFDNEIIGLLVEETNRYATQFFTRFPEKRGEYYYKEWEGCNTALMKAYLGILVHMGLSQFPRLVYHWKSSAHFSCSFCPNVMKRNKFFIMHKFFHITDNSRANNDDRLFKIRPLLELLVTKFQSFYVLNKELSIDERIVKYTGRLSFRQYIPNKPVKLGIKMFVLADSRTGNI